MRKESKALPARPQSHTHNCDVARRLAMLVLVFSAGSDSKSLPSSQLELYRQATRAAVSRKVPSDVVELALSMLTRVAVEAQLAGQREFRQDVHVQAALAGFLEAQQFWLARLQSEAGLPLAQTVQLLRVQVKSCDRKELKD